MKRPYRPFRSPVARLLASVLVTLALLVNGFAVAQAASATASASAKSDCCAGMAAQHGDSAPCHGSGDPCPAAGSDCNDECLARSLVNTTAPSAPAALPEFFQHQPAQLVLMTLAFSSQPASPGLRPPISA